PSAGGRARNSTRTCLSAACACSATAWEIRRRHLLHKAVSVQEAKRWEPLVPWHANLARSQALLAMSYYYSSILADRETSENRLNAREHRFGIWSEEEHAGFLRTLPRSAVAV